MDTFAALLNGFQIALTPANILYSLIGVITGTLIGVLPGLGPAATIAILLPITYNVSPTAALIMLAGIYYGAMFGGSTTSILLNIPGEAASVVTAIDGYKMARQGRAGPALGIAAIGSFIGGTLAIVGLSVVALPLAQFALRFGPPEYMMLALVGLILVIYLCDTSFTKGLLSAFLGVLLACIGQDEVSGNMRFTFGSIDLLKGFDFATVAMGLFGLGEILYNLEREQSAEIISTRIGRIWPSLKDWIDTRWTILRGTVVGFFIGILPGGGAVISSFTAYTIEKKLSKHPERFGKGEIKGVASPETANNAASVASFIPLLTLGIPANVVMAMMYAALLTHGITPGPSAIKEHADVFWGLIASMYLGSAVLLILNLPLVGVFVQLLRVRYSILAPIASLITLIGAYTLNNSFFDVGAVIFFGVIGYLMRKVQMDSGPMVLAFVLAPILETSFRRSLLLSEGSFKIFVDSPIAFILFLIAVGLLVSQLVPAIRKKRGVLAENAEM
ncbi:MAG: tripartite tricarboxylate transporter permease [Actinobacteria bacterium]|nr:tripartite tricarboxylate transporter permease [Actinomycetota bacterium]